MTDGETRVATYSASCARDSAGRRRLCVIAVLVLTCVGMLFVAYLSERSANRHEIDRLSVDVEQSRQTGTSLAERVRELGERSPAVEGTAVPGPPGPVGPAGPTGPTGVPGPAGPHVAGWAWTDPATKTKYVCNRVYGAVFECAPAVTGRAVATTTGGSK